MYLNRAAAIEMQKIVMWVLGILIALAIIGLMVTQLAPGTEGSVTNSTLEKLFSFGS